MDEEILAAQICDSPRMCALVVHDIGQGERPISSTLGVPFRTIDLASDGGLVLGVRAGQYDVISVFDVRDGTRRGPPWTEGQAPRRFLAHAFSEDGTSVRIAGRDGDRLSLWHWDLLDDVVVRIDERPVVDVLPDATARTLLVRRAEGDELWPLFAPLPIPIASLPEGIVRFETSADHGELLVHTDDRIVLVHVATGLARDMPRSTGPFAWLGSAGRAAAESRSWVRIRPDPTPSDPRAFMAWLDGITDVDDGAILVPVSGLAP
jgi:hypothetical protein